MIQKFDYLGKCWWCGLDADSGEHKVKKTDFVSVFGKGPYKKADDKPILVKEGKLIEVQSPNSDYLKMLNCLCKKCNNDRSSSFDRAYAQFMGYVLNHFEEIVSQRIISCAKVFGHDWMEKKANLFKYYTKHIACRAASEGYEISPNIVGFMNGEVSLTDINILFQIRTFNWLLASSLKNAGSNWQTLFLGDLACFSHAHWPLNVVESIASWYTNNWFSMNFLYEKGILNYTNLHVNYLTETDIIPVEVIEVENVPSMSHLTENLQIFEYLEEYDKNLNTEQSFAFLSKLRSNSSIFTR